jgi:hypothetical protein
VLYEEKALFVCIHNKRTHPMAGLAAFARYGLTSRGFGPMIWRIDSDYEKRKSQKAVEETRTESRASLLRVHRLRASRLNRR